MTPKRLDDMLQMSESEFEELLARAAQEGARRALADAGLDGREAAENGGAKLVHGGGGIVLLRAA